jgi:hypothetical protein
MTLADKARVRACFENMIEIYAAEDPRDKEEGNPADPSRHLPQMLQMPQLPQQQTPPHKVLTDREDAFEERAAIMEFDGGMPRRLAGFLAARWR